MKKLVTLLFLIISTSTFGQQINAPEAKTFLSSTNGQDGSGFVLSGFSATSTLLTSISLINPPSGTTFYLNDTRGLIAASGFTLTGNKTRLVVLGTMANINTTLASLKVNTGSVKGNVQLSVAATVNPVGYYYNGVNGHFYRPISTGATYTNARTLSSQQTFKGQQGYLVTITSADEDAFIFANVPQSSIWFALTDEVSEARWTIDAGPENGTLIKINNGQLNGNIPGQYNNWAPGEPNNSGNEDYAVTKWGGGSQWNDLPNNFSCAYVVEFGTWTNPDDQTFTEFYSNSVTHSNGEILRVSFTFDFGQNVDETKFKTKMFTYNDYVSGPYNEAVIGSPYTSFNALGKIDKTTDLDTAKVLTGGKKALTSAGQTEWAIINPYDANLGGHQLLIDQREFDGTVVSPNDVTSIKLFDIYDGPVTVYDVSGWWKIYVMSGNLTNKITSSSFQSQLRLQDGWYGTRAEFTFTDNRGYKNHALLFEPYNETQLQTLLSQAVSVSDVYLAFREFADKGIMGNESKYFSSGIQFQNADVNHDNIFDERDCFKLLKYLQGSENLWESALLPYVMKMVPKVTYDGITKTNWNTFGTYDFLRAKYPISITDGVLNSYNLNISWKGDVNLSHSALPQGYIPNTTSTAMKTMNVGVTTNLVSKEVEGDISMEKVGDNIIVTIKLNTNGNEVGATQFNVYFDNTILDYVKTEYTNETNANFARNNGKVITLGTLNTSGGNISDIEYKVTFKSKTPINDILGLITIQNIETLNTTLKKLLIKII